MVIDAGIIELTTGGEAIKVEYEEADPAVKPNATINGGYIKFTTTDITIDGHRMKMLQGTAMLCEQASWKDTLYRQVQSKNEKVNISLIPYYAWGNRNKCDMTVWMPLGR